MQRGGKRKCEHHRKLRPQSGDAAMYCNGGSLGDYAGCQELARRSAMLPCRQSDFLQIMACETTHIVVRVLEEVLSVAVGVDVVVVVVVLVVVVVVAPSSIAGIEGKEGVGSIGIERMVEDGNRKGRSRGPPRSGPMSSRLAGIPLASMLTEAVAEAATDVGETASP
ncbi:hypothetical protein BDN70DRAFT_569129 [Pholiota conissans]|uniref:Uncharacterized protein n=1 Tax=Pholiota conissans TaxID=109636 RepID=A0A9P6D2W1_9AGAR|nr:hypothetical protein BDN70DRAFT_569129 [Pholiota conissans]